MNILERIFNKNQEERMALTAFEHQIKDRERDRSELLQQLAHLEGSLSGAKDEKVERRHLFDVLTILRGVIETGYRHP